MELENRYPFVGVLLEGAGLNLSCDRLQKVQLAATNLGLEELQLVLSRGSWRCDKLWACGAATGLPQAVGAADKFELEFLEPLLLS